MAREHLSSRDNWQIESSKHGIYGEKVSIDMINHTLNGISPDRFTFPTKFKKIYYPNNKHRVILDSCIMDKITGKVLLVESKRQGKTGNAHERAYKFLPGGGIPDMINEYLTNNTGVEHKKHPVITIFSGDIVLKEKYINEISVQYSRYPYIYLMLDGDEEKTISFFEYIIKAYFDEQDIWC